MKKRHWAGLTCIAILSAGFMVPEPGTVPVMHATINDWHRDSFWYEPWGTSGVHKGIDIFASAGQPVVSTGFALVLYAGTLPKGGNIVVSLGPKWRLHYYVHLNTTEVGLGQRIKPGEKIGDVGNSGNAAGKPAHLHYSILSLMPYPWRIDGSPQGWKKAFYLNPDQYLREL